MASLALEKIICIHVYYSFIFMKGYVYFDNFYDAAPINAAFSIYEMIVSV